VPSLSLFFSGAPAVILLMTDSSGVPGIIHRRGKGMWHQGTRGGDGGREY
jgi:hypothetical protein